MPNISQTKKEYKTRLLHYDERIEDLKKALLDLHPLAPNGSQGTGKFRRYDKAEIKHMRVEQERIRGERHELMTKIECEYGRDIIREWRKKDKERKEQKRAARMGESEKRVNFVKGKEVIGGETMGEKILNTICFWKK